MRKKKSKPARKWESRSGNNPPQRRSKQNSELQEEIRIGREFMAQYEAKFRELAKS
jgi:hypothetical protein